VKIFERDFLISNECCKKKRFKHSKYHYVLFPEKVYVAACKKMCNKDDQEKNIRCIGMNHDPLDKKAHWKLACSMKGEPMSKRFVAVHRILP